MHNLALPHYIHIPRTQKILYQLSINELIVGFVSRSPGFLLARVLMATWLMSNELRISNLP